jgi:hypothetical protein
MNRGAPTISNNKETDIGPRRLSDHPPGEQAAQPAEEDRCPHPAKQYALVLDCRHGPEEREAQPKPDPAEEPEIAIEDRDIEELQRSVQRIPHTAHADDPGDDGHQREGAGAELQ